MKSDMKQKDQQASKISSSSGYFSPIESKQIEITVRLNWIAEATRGVNILANDY